MKYKIILLSDARADLEYWKHTNPVIVRRIKVLLKDIQEHPYSGIGIPEALRFNLAGKWSRRINHEHRIIYSLDGNKIFVYVFSMRSHC
jgi:toxin YoeB